MKKKLATLFILATLAVATLSSCSEAERARMNLSQEADNFNCYRQLTVINCIQGDVLFQMEGVFSIEADREDNQLEIIVQEKGLGDDYVYTKHFVGLSDNVTYVLEDLGTYNVDEYSYTINFNPKMWIPAKGAVID